MTNKMAATVLTYELGSQSYGDSKLKKWKKFKKTIIQQSLSLIYGKTGFFGTGKEWYHFQQQLMVSKTIVKLFIAMAIACVYLAQGLPYKAVER